MQDELEYLDNVDELFGIKPLEADCESPRSYNSKTTCADSNLSTGASSMLAKSDDPSEPSEST